MDKRTAIIKALKQQALLPLFYDADASVCISIMQHLYKAGVRLIEFTNRGEHALDNFKKMKEASKGMDDLLWMICLLVLEQLKMNMLPKVL